MYIVFCKNCGDFLSQPEVNKTKVCTCGQTKFKALNQKNNEYSGRHAIPLSLLDRDFVYKTKKEHSDTINKRVKRQGYDISLRTVPFTDDNMKKKA